MPISSVRLKDGSSVTVNPTDPGETHAITEGRRGLIVHCFTNGKTRRIPWRRIHYINRREF